MKLALLSDIHANLRALHACLAHAQEAGATHHAVLGDLPAQAPDTHEPKRTFSPPMKKAR